MRLTSEQKNIILKLINRTTKTHVQTLGGYAGTGKTTIVRNLSDALPEYGVCAYTGKAANILRKKGINASTIHRLIYKAVVDNEGNLILDAYGNPQFKLTKDIDCKGIIIDEASMVGKEIYQDLLSFNKPLIFVGDHGQLEPIGESMNLMQTPDLKLETIHRNAGPIAHFAEYIRKGYRPASYDKGGDIIRFVNQYQAEAYLTKVDQIICAYNKFRVTTNRKIRKLLNHNPVWPVVDDKIMCLRNDYKKNLFNGMQGIISSVEEKPKNKMKFESDDVQYEVRFDPAQFNNQKHDFDLDKDAPSPFDYAYCITCHKAQGDEFNKVMVFEQKCDLWDHRRWAYTAASRAKQSIIWVT